MGRRKQSPPALIEPEDESQEPLEDEDDQDDQDDQEEPGTSRPRGNIKKTDAVRQALAAGYDSPGDAVDFIRRQFGIEMQKTHFSAVKSQLKKREAEGGGEPKKGPEGAQRQEARGCRGLSGSATEAIRRWPTRPTRRDGGHEAARREPREGPSSSHR